MESTMQNHEPVESKVTAAVIEKDLEPQAPTLPPLSKQEFRAYNHMAEHMDIFHSNFRRTWSVLKDACNTSSRPQGMSLRQFLNLITQFTHHLTIHHTIEEQHIFPVLATKMPFFRPESAAIKDHAVIHEGVEALENWVEAIESGEKEIRLAELQNIMESFGDVLWKHLDEEVEMLGAENMRKYWTIEEMRVMPM